MQSSKPTLVNLNSLDFTPNTHGETFKGLHASVGRALGARKLGCRVTILPPGKAAWAFHAHLVNEELFFFLQGRGNLRFGESSVPVKEGDFVVCPPGKDSAHQLMNDGTEDLLYLAVSTMEEPDIVHYPDSGKVGVFAGSPPGGPKKLRTLSGFFREADAVDYWEGE